MVLYLLPTSRKKEPLWYNTANPSRPGGPLRKKLLPAILLLVLAGTLLAQKTYPGQSIEEILALPEDQIDTGHACLVLAKDAYPDLNVAAFDCLLDEMAGRINALLRGRSEPEQRIGMTNTYLYRPGWWNENATFEYNRDDLLAQKKESQFLNGYLATRKGSCLTMAMLYLALADRLGWPIRAVRAPYHYFCRDAGMKDGNLEATGFGGFTPDSAYIADLKVPEAALRSGAYMKSLTRKEYLATLLEVNARLFHDRGDLRKAIYYLELSVANDPAFSGGHWNLANYTYRYAKKLAEEAGRAPRRGFLPPGYSGSPQLVQLERESINSARMRGEAVIVEMISKSDRHRTKAKELGIVLESPEDFLKSQLENIAKSDEKARAEGLR